MQEKQETQEKQEKQTFHPAQAAQEFMARTDMKGREVEAYAQTFNWLAAIIGGTLVVLTRDDYEFLTKAGTEGLGEDGQVDDIPTLAVD